jgi:hypothetical protein
MLGFSAPMTLAPGTALQNGSYVVEAPGLEDSIGPVYLATDVPQGRWVQLRILGSHHPAAMPMPEIRDRFYQRLGTLADLNHPLLPLGLGGFEEEGVCYQTLPGSLGVPFTQLVTPQSPYPLEQAVLLGQQLVDLLLALGPQGWGGIRLTLDQLWQGDKEPSVTFIGFDLPPAEPEAEEAQEAALVKALGQLLYHVLAGSPPTQVSSESRAIALQQQRPDLPPNLIPLLAPEAQAEPVITLADWRSRLAPLDGPLPTTPEPAIDPVIQPVVPAPSTLAQAPTPPRTSLQPSWKFVIPGALMVTGLVASLTGLGVGLYARLQPSNGTSSAVDRLNPSQSFPSLPDWSADDWSNSDLWQPWDQAPNRRRDRPSYGEAPSSRPASPTETPSESTPPTVAPVEPRSPAPERSPSLPSEPTVNDPVPERRPEPVTPAVPEVVEPSTPAPIERNDPPPPAEPPPPLTPPTLSPVPAAPTVPPPAPLAPAPVPTQTRSTPPSPQL